MKTKEKLSFGSIVSKIINKFVVPLFIVGLFAMIVTALSAPTGSMPQVFGISLVRIQSGSMVEKGFAIGDVVLMSQNHEKPLDKGQIIAFYNRKDAYDATHYGFMGSVEESSLVEIENYDGQFATNVAYVSGRTNPQDLQNHKAPITFHEIINVYVSPDGIVFYETSGSNPSSVSDGLIRQDFVVAKYINTPFALKAVMSFSITEIGIILFMFVPLTIVIGIEGYNTLKKVYAYWVEGQLFDQKIPFSDPRIKLYNVASLMTEPRKAYFWLLTDKSKKQEVFEFLFKPQEESDKKQIEMYENAKKAKEIFENKGPLEYFRFWHLTLGGYFDKKEIVKYKKDYENKLLTQEKK